MKTHTRRSCPSWSTPVLCTALIAFVLSGQVPSLAQQFTRVIEGAIVNSGANSISLAWEDYDGDGDLDLAVANLGQGTHLFRNDGAVGFVRVTQAPFDSGGGSACGTAWADIDADGDLDLLVTSAPGASSLFKNEGSGQFSLLASDPLTMDGGYSIAPAWSDFDGDGDLDCFISRGGGWASQLSGCYRNDGAAGFVSVEGSPLNSRPAGSMGAAWADYNDDGWPDLVVMNIYSPGPFLYRNRGDGSFDAIKSGPVVNTIGGYHGCAWGDFDNDGDLDLFLANPGANNHLYRNHGTGGFALVHDSIVTTDSVANGVGCAFADYDNDGWLDLLVANRGQSESLYHNRGDGTFEKIIEGSLVNDGGNSNGCGWGDYDNDGFLDVAIANWDGQDEFLYHNNGNANNWLKIRLSGLRSNRLGVGAKIRVKATLNGVELWQRRDVGSHDALGTLPLIASFGLGGATNVDLVRIEWPSGVVQEIRDVAPRQMLTVTETLTPLWCLPVPGEYSWPVSAVLRTGINAGEIRYTMDGTDPTTASPLYAAPIQLSSTTTLKAQVFTNAVAASELLTAAYVIVLPPPDAFQRVTTGAPATDTGEAFSAAWSDYDADGRLDLFVSRLGGQHNALYHNEGGSTFTAVPAAPPAAEPGVFTAGAWADANSDGRPDVLVTRYPGVPQLFLNDGAGSFAAPHLLATEPAAPYSMGPAWADLNRDGVLDFFIANGGGSAQQNNSLALGLPGGGFQMVTNSPATATLGYSCGASFADFNGDLAPDLVVANMWASGQLELYRNDGTGNLVAVTDTPVTQTTGSFNGTAWGDYDNDGRPDLFVAGAPSGLFRNLGGGQFASVTSGAPMVASPPPNAIGCAWLDQNNDGWLDLFVTSRGGNNVLYRNQGDGTFMTITEGEFVDDGGASNGCAVGDYDGDGYPDLFIANWNGEQSFLLRNGGGSHHWLKIRCVGVRSNRDGLGAAVRIRTLREGGALNQLREITGGDAYGSHPLIAHFGLGAATNVDLLRIEWPSGIVQELQNVAADQSLTVTEAAGPLWFRPWAGEYHAPVEAQMETSIEGAEIRYTMNGSNPAADSTLYPPSPRLLATTELKAQAYTNGVAASEVVSATYTVILTPPAIVSQPTNVVAYIGQTTSLAVVATGSAPLAYQWRFGGTDLADATQPTLILTNPTPAMTGDYVLQVTNDAGAIFSAPITVSVVPPPQRPSILQQPTSQMVVTGGRAVFRVVVTGDPPLTFAWRRVGQSTILGTDPTLTLDNVQPSQAGSYRVLISNPVGTTTSATASLIVVSQPQAPTITTQTGAQRPAAGDPVTLNVAVTGTQPLVYQWRRNGELLSTAQGPSLKLDSVTIAQAGTYAVTVSNDAGSAVSQPIIVDVIDSQTGGTILFDNRADSIDAPVFDADGTTPLSSMTYLAQLYAGPSEAALQPVGAALPFGTGNAAGYWLTGLSAVRTVPTVPPGEIAVALVRAWEAESGPSYEQALVSGGKVGSSRYLLVTTGGTGEPPGIPSPLAGLQSFSLARESEPPVITLLSPDNSITSDERFALAGTVSDNGRVAAVRWELDGLARGPVPFTNGQFALDSLRLHHGTNVVRVVVTDAAGNEATAEATPVWNPLRTLALHSAPPVQEGGRIALPLVLSSTGDVAGLTFTVTFDPVSLEDATLDWTPAVEGATRAITIDPAGRVRATLAFAGQAIPAGEVTLAELSFRARSIPTPRSTPLSVELADISDPAGDPLTYGTEVLGTSAELTLRTLIGDNNANQRLDIGDASIIQRFLNTPPLQTWDVTGNDLNRSLTLDSGDVIKVLRVVVGIDASPTGSMPAPQTTPARRGGLLPQGPPAVSGRVTLTGQRISANGGEQVVLQVGLADLDRPISGASFVLRYPAAVLVVSGAAAHQTGSLVPPSALALWNVTEDYAQQSGVLTCATASGEDWTATNGVLAEVTFTVRPGLLIALADLHVGPVEITTDHGFEVFPLAGAQLDISAVLPVSTETFTAPTLTSTGFQFTVAGPVGGQAVVEVSTDLVHWEPLSTVPLVAGTGRFEDPAAGTQSARFYRVK